jgi:S1-C subfamily serine protease
MRDSDLLAYGVNAHKPGETVAIKVLRDGKTLEMKLPIQQ